MAGIISPYEVSEHTLSRYTIANWREAGIDIFTQPPAQSESSLMQIENTLSPLTGVFQRRWGYRTFYPQLDTGSGDEA